MGKKKRIVHQRSTHNVMGCCGYVAGVTIFFLYRMQIGCRITEIKGKCKKLAV